MAEWKVLLARHLGSQDRRLLTCQSIRNMVEDRALAQVFPMVKYEIKRGRSQEYYLGLYLDVSSSRKEFHPEATGRELLMAVGVRDFGTMSLISPEEASGFLRGSASESFCMPIRFERKSSTDNDEGPEAAMTAADLSEFTSKPPESQEAEAYSRLLMWCSSTGTGNLQQFRFAAETLGIDLERSGGAWGVLRRMVLLGHLEYDPSKNFRWGVIPPVLVEPDVTVGYRILAGQRTPSLLAELEEQFEVEVAPQHGGPAAIIVYSGDQQVIRPGGHPVIQAGCISRVLVEHLPELQTWIAMLPPWVETDLKRFEGRVYNLFSDSFQAIPPVLGNPSPGLYQFSLRNPQTDILVYRDEQNSRWVGGDYYGLRFLARHHAGITKAWYDAPNDALVLPLQDRWPMPYERALVLASGCLPQLLSGPSGMKLLSYVGVTRPLAEALARKLGVTLETI